MAEPFIKIEGNGTLIIDGASFPTPARGLKPTVFTVVDNARNLNGVTVGQRIGRDQFKLDGLAWKVLSAEQWSKLLTVISTFYFSLTFQNPVTDSPVTITAYCGDRSAEPYWIDNDSGKVLMYRNCSVNFIDTGK